MRERKLKRLRLAAGLAAVCGLLSGVLCMAAPETAYAEPEPVVVVIDPGHGGSNEGGISGDLTEKELTLKVALAMKTELEKYDNVIVYLTRTADVELSLEERVAYAVSVGADFFFCLHFNMSASHTLYGAECWVSAYGDCYAKGYDFATIEEGMLTELGLYERGIKTRLRSSGDADYYGVIRSATAAGMPSVIIEHCHLDNAMDAPYIDSDVWPAKYGVLDATAVAKYFGLQSEELGVDYGGVTYSATETPSSVVLPDTTAPDVCTVTSAMIDVQTDTIRIECTASDAQSRMLYYTWSTDNGATFAELQEWTKGADAVSFEIPVPENGEGTLVVRCYNLYDLWTDSAAAALSELETVGEDAAEETQEQEETEAPEDGFRRVVAIIVVLAAVFMMNAGIFTLCVRRRIPARSYRVLIPAVSLAGVVLILLIATVGRNTGGTEISEEAFMEQNFYYTELTDEIREKITGSSYPDAGEALVISYEDLAYVHALHYDFDGQVREGEMICNRAIAEDLVEIFQELYLAEYPIEKMVLVDAYDGDDEASMADNNSSCFNYRVISGTTKISNHAYGLAVDINPLYNPYVTGEGDSARVQPANAAVYTDREADFPYKIDHGDLCYQLFTAHGFTWGGDWTSSKDYQHFEKTEF